MFTCSILVSTSIVWVRVVDSLGVLWMMDMLLVDGLDFCGDEVE